MNDYFGSTYGDARARFLAACLHRGVAVRTHVNSLHRGPQGELLCTDVAVLGAADAERVLIIQSGTHGAEGFCGSGVQVGLLLEAEATQARQSNTALVLVHAINPYGFAWTRRSNEDNIDLNRHFVNFEAGEGTDNRLYGEIADLLIPRRREDLGSAANELRLKAFYERHGEWQARQAERAGQTTHPHGLHFRGTAPSWSRQIVSAICDEFLSRARYAALIDIHTGLGPYGYGEPLTVAPPGSDQERRCKAWYGDDVRSTVNPAAGYAGAKGSMIAGYANAAPRVDWTSIGLEFGTLPHDIVTRAERADAWLHTYGEPESEIGRQIKLQMRAALYPDSDEWRRLIWRRSAELTRLALSGLGSMVSGR